MIELKNNGLVDENKLNYIETQIFIEFLKIERDRHSKDIDNINNTLNKLSK